MQEATLEQSVPARPRLSFLIGLLRIVLFIVLITSVAIFAALGGEWLGRHVWPGIAPLFHGAVWIAGTLLVTWLVRVKIDKRPWSQLALPRPQLLRLAAGAIAGLALIVAASCIEYELGWLHVIRIDTAAHRGVGKALWLALYLTPSLAVGICEELGFRGYVFQTLGERVPVWAAAIVMSVIFALCHFTLTGFNAAFVVSVTLISLTFLSLRYATGSLWFPIGFHGAWDWTQTYLVGLSTTGAGNDPALVQIRQTGSRFWVGDQPTIESGALFLLIELGVLAVALIYANSAGKAPLWRQRLDAAA